MASSLVDQSISHVEVVDTRTVVSGRYQQPALNNETVPKPGGEAS